jgi:hypothetical protein
VRCLPASLPACCWLPSGCLASRRPAALPCYAIPSPTLPGSALLLLLASSLALPCLLCLLLCLLAAESLVPEPLQKAASPQEFMDSLHEVGACLCACVCVCAR